MYYYNEHIDGDVRIVESNGCPNHNPNTMCVANNPNPHEVQDNSIGIPAFPVMMTDRVHSLSDAPGAIGLALDASSIYGCLTPQSELC
eukprot:UN34384